VRIADKNTRTLFSLAVIVGLMVGVSFACVPLYTLFCRVTGFGGTTQRVTTAPTHKNNRYITVSFDSNVDSSLPWDFVPEVKNMSLKLGEVATVRYRAHNLSNKTLVGTATFNVQPDIAGAYFDKIQCFCFTKQIIKGGETVELPVQFYIDPTLADDLQNDQTKNITLSYTFFLSKDQGKVSLSSSNP
jgi:cytochrome c oxidase assembly protein subunit 11